MCAAVVFGLTVLLAGRAWFFTDDVLIADYFTHEPIDLANLTRSWFGHLMPGYILAAATFLRVFGLNWSVAMVVIAVIHTGAFVALVRCLDATNGRQRLNIVAGLLFTCSVAVLATRLWWAASLNNMVALAFCLSTMGATARWVTTHRSRYLWSALLSYALAVVFSEKSLLFSVWTVLWCVLVIWRELPWRERFTALLRRWPLWLGILVISAVDVGVFVSGAYVQESGETATLGASLLFIGWGLVGGFIPSLFGPDLWLVDPWWGPVAIVGCSLVLLAAVVLTLLRRRRLAGVWVFVALAVLVNQTVLSRRAELLGLDGGRILRYHVENTALFWLGAAVVAYVTLSRPATGRDDDRVAARPVARRRWATGGVVVSVVSLLSLAMWAQSTYITVTTSVGYQARGWIDEVTATWPTEPEPAFNRLPLPCCIGLPGMYSYNMNDVVLPLIHPEVRFSDQLEGSFALTTEGAAGPAVFLPAASATVGSCLDPGAALTVPALAADPYQVVRIAYRATTGGLLTTSTGHRGQLEYAAGTTSVIDFLPTGFAAGTFTLTAASAEVCIDTVEVGSVTAFRVA